MSQIIQLQVARKSRPTAINGKVSPPRRKKNTGRQFLTEKEVEKLLKAAGKAGRHPERDKALILVAYRHGLRVSELVDLRWEQVDLKDGVLHVRRLKNGTDTTHPISGPVLRALRTLPKASPFVFYSERGGPLTTSTVRKLLARAGEAAGLEFAVHPHMLRHGCGYKLANDGQDTRLIQHYLGHKNIMHTVRYTELSPHRFKNLWGD
jgi:type 1 fimbriae regulatory protein FimB/type 1 fimbriae regulatory protein FimE